MKFFLLLLVIFVLFVFSSPILAIITFSPNPLTTSATIHLTSKEQGAEGKELRIYDASGKLVESVPLTTNHLSLGTDLIPGIYFLKLTAGEYTETKKLIKIR